MYVAPSARRRGVARTLLAALEDAARDRGYAFVRLDTGPRQQHAVALYASAGYTEIANFNANPIAAYWGEKRL
jgi:ribosomal protein S18 acetylase RimI-like enzyme